MWEAKHILAFEQGELEGSTNVLAYWYGGSFEVTPVVEDTSFPLKFEIILSVRLKICNNGVEKGSVLFQHYQFVACQWIPKRD